jgi:hypothetical protein
MLFTIEDTEVHGGTWFAYLIGLHPSRAELQERAFEHDYHDRSQTRIVTTHRDN